MKIKLRTWERVKQEFILFHLFIFRPQNASSHEHSLTMRYWLCKGFVRKVFVFFTRVNVGRYSLISNANTIRTHAFGQLLVAYHHSVVGGGGCSVKDVFNTIFVIEASVFVIKIQSH